MPSGRRKISDIWHNQNTKYPDLILSLIFPNKKLPIAPVINQLAKISPTESSSEENEDKNSRINTIWPAIAVKPANMIDKDSAFFISCAPESTINQTV